MTNGPFPPDPEGGPAYGPGIPAYGPGTSAYGPGGPAGGPAYGSAYGPGLAPGGFGPGDPPPRRGLSGGAIAGIVAGVVVLVLLCGGSVVAGVALFAGSRAGDSDSGSDAGADAAGDAKALDDVVDYRQDHPTFLTRNHRTGPIRYLVSPSVGGDHSAFWQNCEGDVYDAQIPTERATHSLEHGAVWITYRPDLPADQVAVLAGVVRNRPYLMMSPFPGLDSPVSLQAWGYRLQVTDASSPGVAAFVRRFRVSASVEPGATCGNGRTGTGTDPDRAD